MWQSKPGRTYHSSENHAECTSMRCGFSKIHSRTCHFLIFCLMSLKYESIKSIKVFWSYLMWNFVKFLHQVCKLCFQYQEHQIQVYWWFSIKQYGVNTLWMWNHQHCFSSHVSWWTGLNPTGSSWSHNTMHINMYVYVYIRLNGFYSTISMIPHLKLLRVIPSCCMRG